MSITPDRVELSDHDAALFAQASRLMSEALDRSRVRRIALVEEKADGSDFARLEVPPATLRLLSQILALMARQQTFILYPESSELTTKQAAELLGVSRPFLIGILESGAIPHRKIGRHRRVLMKDVLAYKKTMQVNRRAALDELVKASEDAGGYDLQMVPFDRFAVVLDACIMFPMLVRDVLLTLAANEFFSPKWSPRIRDEWTRNLIALVAS